MVNQSNDHGAGVAVAVRAYGDGIGEMERGHLILKI
jgi:hypothetical protein